MKLSTATFFLTAGSAMAFVPQQSKVAFRSSSLSATETATETKVRFAVVVVVVLLLFVLFVFVSVCVYTDQLHLLLS
jgi:protein-S-isoprenylcysteine O-methyltransferase Ste14